MELQDFVLKSVTSQLRFSDLTPRFVDNRGRLIEQLVDRYDLSQWGYGEDFIEVSKPDQSLTLLVSNRELRAIFENVDSSNAAGDLTHDFFEHHLDELAVKQLATVGVRSWWLAASDSFEQLNSFLIDRLSPDAQTLFDAVGSQPTDTGWVFDFHGNDPKHNVRIGPMRPEQAMAQVFRDKNPENYPPQFLYLDVDRIYSTEPTPGERALDRWRSTFTRNLEVGEQICRLLTP